MAEAALILRRLQLGWKPSPFKAVCRENFSGDGQLECFHLQFLFSDENPHPNLAQDASLG